MSENEDDTEKWKQVFASFAESQLSSSLFLHNTIHRKKALNFILSVNNSLGHCLSISTMQQFSYDLDHPFHSLFTAMITLEKVKIHSWENSQGILLTAHDSFSRDR